MWTRVRAVIGVGAKQNYVFFQEAFALATEQENQEADPLLGVQKLTSQVGRATILLPNSGLPTGGSGSEENHRHSRASRWFFVFQCTQQQTSLPVHQVSRAT